MKKTYLYIATIVLANILFLSGYANSLYAADVIAPSKDNIFTLTVTNIGSEKLEGVNVAASVVQNPGGLITIKDVSPRMPR